MTAPGKTGSKNEMQNKNRTEKLFGFLSGEGRDKGEAKNNPNRLIKNQEKK